MGASAQEQLTGVDQGLWANITTQYTGRATHPSGIQSNIMLFNTEGLNHRYSFFFSSSKRMTNISPSLDRQAWTITISTGKKLNKQYFVGLLQFWMSCRKCNYSFFQLQNILCTNRIKISTEVSQMHEYVTCPVPVTSCSFPTLPHERVELAVPKRHFLYPEDLHFLQPSTPLPPCCVFIGQSRMNHRMVTKRCHVIGWDDAPQ